MSIIQTFYDNLATQYDKLFLDWQSTTKEQAEILNRIFQNNGFDNTAGILDCACGIGTQAIGIASLGYNVSGLCYIIAYNKDLDRRYAKFDDALYFTLMIFNFQKR